MKTKRKKHKTKDPNYNTYTYGSSKSPFDIEWIKYYNPVEGRDQILFLYKKKRSKTIVKYRIMR
jgi:hypothetical protein